MSKEIDDTLEGLKNALYGVNDLNNNLNKIENLYNQFDEKSKIIIDKISTADSKLDNALISYEDIKTIKKNFDEEYDKIRSIVKNKIIPFESELKDIKKQIIAFQETIDNMNKSDTAIKLFQSQSLKLEKEIMELKSDNEKLFSKYKQLETFVTSKSLISPEKSIEKKDVVVIKKNLDNANQSKNKQDSELKNFFIENGYEVIDKRANGGALWVVGDEIQLSPILEKMKHRFGDVTGSFGAGHTTNQRRSWYTKDKR